MFDPKNFDPRARITPTNFNSSTNMVPVRRNFQQGELPPSFAQSGFSRLDLVRPRRRLMIGTEGQANTGKTEFILSCPGPGIIVVVDRGYDACLDNPNPPTARRSDFAFATVGIPNLTSGLSQEEFGAYWEVVKDVYYRALANPDAATVAMDGDSDTWPLQRLAAFGKLKQVPSLSYDEVNAARRNMIHRAFDSCRVIVSTHRVTDQYVDEISALNGQPTGRKKKSGELKREGFNDFEYLWSIQLRHLFRSSSYNAALKRTIPSAFGIKILMCKPNMDLAGEELWGPDCNFAGLVKLVYPQVPMEEWFR